MRPVNVRNIYGTAAQKFILAEHQPEYEPLPALYVPAQGYVLTEWTPTPDELAALNAGGRVRLFSYTFGHPFQAVQLVAVPSEECLALEPTN